MPDYHRIDDHPLWETHVLPLLFTNGDDPRERIELREPGTPHTRLMLLHVEIECVACSAVILPLRQRKAASKMWGSIYLTVACPSEVNPACSRGTAAALETIRIRNLIKGWHDPKQPGLFW